MRCCATHDDSGRWSQLGCWRWLPVIGVIWLGPLFAAPGDDSSNRGSKAPGQARAGASPVEAITTRVQQDLNKSAPNRTEPVAVPKSPDSSTTPSAETVAAAGTEKPADEAPASARPKRAKPGSSAGKTGDRAKALEAEAQQCRTAEEALMLYKTFLSDEDTTEIDKEKAQPRLEYWEQAAKDGLERVGKNWLPKAEAEKLKEEADKLVTEAIELIRVESHKKADEKLEKALKVYPDHLGSVFILGIGALIWSNDAKGAEKRFTQCLAIDPDSVPVLNNAALCAAVNKKFDRAVKFWEKASTVEPENATIIQNLGHFVSQGNKGKAMTREEKDKAIGAAASAKAKGQIFIDVTYVDRRVLDNATEIYLKLVAGDKAPSAKPGGNYLVSLTLAEPKKGGSEGIVGNGSGFVIWDGFVLTNRHVVEGASGLMIQDPDNPLLRYAAKVVAISTKEMDLAIVRCEALKAPRVAIGKGALPRGSEVLALGFPVMGLVGKGLKATRGIVTGLPSADTGNLMVLDVQVNPGNSGGPLSDNAGRVRGVVAAKTFTERRAVQSYGLAIPMSIVVPFVKQTIPQFGESDGDDKKLEWTEVDARLSKSTVCILIKQNTGAPPANAAPQAAPNSPARPSTKPSMLPRSRTRKS